MKKLEELLNTESEIDIFGRLINIRALGKKLKFLTLSYGNQTIQIVYDSEEKLLVNNQDIIKVTGKVIKNPQVKSGISGYELRARNIELLTKGNADIINDLSSIIEVSKRRLLEAKVQYMSAIRSTLGSEGLLEVKSPTIVQNMVGNYNEAFKVNFFDSDASLTISNVLYHQILLANDFIGVYEISPVFRASKSRTRRHLSEIMMLDYSIPHTSMNEVVQLTNKVLANAIEAVKQHADIIPNLNVPTEISYTDLVTFVKNKGGSAEMGDKTSAICKKNKEIIQSNMGKLVWIYNTPIVNSNDFIKKRKNIQFYDDAELRFLDVGQLASGSAKITDYKELVGVMSDTGVKIKEFQPYLLAIKHGIPPNSGVGLGLDRIYMAIVGANDIRDVIFCPISLRTA